MIELPPRYNPKDVEDKWLAVWKEKNIFHATVNPSKIPYTIVIPPPNVTGILHMGHALNNTLQDILIRYKRMKGFEACWMPGTDHAGIATQNVVEKQLAKEGKRRDDLGREEFVKRLWAWKNEYGNTILRQLEKLGSSCDWPRARFTMDDDYSDAVKEVFVRLYEKGLIYRGQYIINWCPRCQTALSDEEAEHQEKNGKLYQIKYPLKSSVIARSEALTQSSVEIASAQKAGLAMTQEDPFVIVATTRPETMLGDTAVAVNPKDKRYAKLVGQTLVLPLIGREIKIIADDFVSMEFGTGAVKVTPAHDPNDFAMGKRHNLEFINIMHPDATLNENAGRFSGLDRFAGRKAVVDALEADGLLVKIEDHRHAVGHCYRCDTVVEPYLSPQWFVKMKPLAEPALKAVVDGRIRISPERWQKVYINWMEGIRDWCISRQIWWGHRIPVWYCQNVTCQHIICSKEIPSECTKCHSTNLKQDEDVLDTWFSSWLWPFATFGWPKDDTKTQGHKDKNRATSNEQRATDLEYFYPTNSLFTASEILFFWVARMIMAGYEFMGDAPFTDVYIHGTVRDAKGRKMSKSLGNAIDPLEVIDEFGADALRFSLIINSGQDIFISKEKFEIGRNFANKIWNASRLVLMNVKLGDLNVQTQEIDYTKLDLPSRWILSKLNRTIKDVADSIERFRYSEAESLVYEFFWKNYCDWYLEIIKDKFADAEIQKTTVFVIKTSLQIMHPFIPFVTEEIYSKIYPGSAPLSVASWPNFPTGWEIAQVEDEMNFLIEIISQIRNVRTHWNVKASDFVDCLIETKDNLVQERIRNSVSILKRLGRIDRLDFKTLEQSVKVSAAGVVGECKFYVPLAGLIDVEKEKQRILKHIEFQTKSAQSIRGRLETPTFIDKAPVEVVEKDRERLKALELETGQLQMVLKNFS